MPKNTGFWYVTPCSIEEEYRRTLCLHLQDRELRRTSNQQAIHLTCNMASGMTCRKHYRDEKCIHNFVGKIKGINHLEEICTQMGRKWLLKKWVAKVLYDYV